MKKEEISKMMSALAIYRHSQETPEEKTEKGIKMNLASQKARKIGIFRRKKLSTDRFDIRKRQE